MPVIKAEPPLLLKLYEFEINVNRQVQQQMSFKEQLLQDVNTYLDPQMVLDWLIPLLGAFSHKLMARMVVAVGILNVICSLFKWAFQEFRPVWLIREFNITNSGEDFNTAVNTCDTSGGFPSNHAFTFALFTFVFFHWLVQKLGSSLRQMEKYFITHAIVAVFSVVVWSSRLYFLSEFLHQCIAGHLLAMVGLYSLQRNTANVLRWRALKTSVVVALMGSVAVATYVAKLHLDADPHWSVRMAFKWCADPSLMRHEAGPIFIMIRDFGFLLGIALSCPLLNSYTNNKSSIFKRLPTIAVIVFLNVLARQNTPKHLGRFTFLVYEFGRNCIHSYTLLSIVPKIIK